jgi:invasion protein IalB
MLPEARIDQRRPIMKRTALAALAIAGSAMLGVSAAAPAMASAPSTYSKTYVYTTPHAPEKNKASYWGYNCYKKEGDFGKYKYLPYKQYSKVIVKAGQQNTVFVNFSGGKVYAKNGKDISHIIICPKYYSHY